MEKKEEEEIVTATLPAQEPEESEVAPSAETETETKEAVQLDGNALTEDFDKVLADLKTAAHKETTTEEKNPAEDPAPTGEADDDKSTELETGKTETEDKTKAFTVTDEYIKSQPEELREILAGIKGDTISPRALKNYLHAEQEIISNRAKEQPGIVKLEDITIPENERQFVNDLAYKKLLDENPGLKEKAAELKEHGITDPERVMQEYLRDLNADNPEQAIDFVANKRATYTGTEKEIKEAIYIKKNENYFARQAINKAREIYIDQIKKLGIEDPEGLIKETGIDFTVLDANGSNAILKELIWAKSNLPSPVSKFGGNGDPNDFNDTNATYLFNPEIIALRAFALKSEPLFKAHQLRITKASFEKGFKSKAEKENGFPPSHSTSSITGQPIVKQNNFVPEIRDNDLTGNDDETLKKIKATILKN